MSESETRLASLVHLIEHAMSTPPENDHVLTTPDGADWAEATLSHDQLDHELREGDVHRHHGEP